MLIKKVLENRAGHCSMSHFDMVFIKKNTTASFTLYILFLTSRSIVWSLVEMRGDVSDVNGAPCKGYYDTLRLGTDYAFSVCLSFILTHINATFWQMTKSFHSNYRKSNKQISISLCISCEMISSNSYFQVHTIN